MVNKKLKDVISYFHCNGEITIVTADKTFSISPNSLTEELLNKKVRSSQSLDGHLTVWMELEK